MKKKFSVPGWTSVNIWVIVPAAIVSVVNNCVL